MIKFCYQDAYQPLKICQGVSFSPREIDIASCLLNGHTSKKSIAALMRTEVRTIETHIYNMMRKVNGSSWERIRDFFEKSNLSELYRQHFKIVLQTKAFHQILQEIKPAFKEKYISVFIVYDEHHKTLRPLIKQLKDFFTAIEVNVFIKNKLSYAETLQKNRGFIAIYLSSSHERELAHGDDTFKQFLGDSLLSIKVYEDANIDAQYTNRPNSNVFILCLTILKTILPGSNFERYNLALTSLHLETPTYVDRSSTHENQTTFLVHRRPLKGLTFVAIICIILLGLIHYSTKSIIRLPLVSSELRLPDHSILLERKDYIHKMHMLLKKKVHEIPVVVLLGDGGSGKTTLARLFARSKGYPVIWELNAETPNTLYESFKALAYVIARQTSQERKLERLQAINNVSLRTQAIINFVQDELKHTHSWLIIFDNVDSLRCIYPYLPQNNKNWGNGNVIITTRNSIIKQSDFISKLNVIPVGLLSMDEAVDLFTGILTNSNPTLASKYNKGSTELILTNLPKFPLDIVVAAKYISAEDMSFETYLHRVNSPGKEMSSVYKKEKDVQSETSDYHETRYKIVALSVERIIKENPKVKDLFYLISNMQSQNIPLDLFEQNYPKTLIQVFLSNLQRYYLADVRYIREGTTMLSIQRSVHKILYTYFNEGYSHAPDSASKCLISDKLASYINSIADKEDFYRMRIFLPHLDTIVKNGGLDTRQPIYKASLGYFLYYTGDNHEKAMRLLENCTNIHHNSDQSEKTDLARILLYLGSIYRINGKITLAKSTLEEALKINDKFELKDPSLLKLKINLNLEKVYLALGNYEKTISLACQDLKEYQAHYPSNVNGICRLLILLGRSYKELGKYEAALKYFNEAFRLLRHNNQENHIAFALACLGVSNCYEALGNYKRALKYADLSDTFYQSNYPHNHINIAWSLSHKVRLYNKLGLEKERYQLLMMLNKNLRLDHPETNVHEVDWIIAYTGITFAEIGEYKLAMPYLEKALNAYTQLNAQRNANYLLCKFSLARVLKEQGDYHKSKVLFSECVSLFENHFGKNHLHSAQLLGEFSDLYLLEGNILEAERLLLNSLNTLDAIRHADCVFTLKRLGVLYLKKAESIRSRNLQKASRYSKEGLLYLERAYATAQEQFPEDSIHLIQLKTEIANLKMHLPKMPG